MKLWVYFEKIKTEVKALRSVNTYLILYKVIINNNK